MRRFALFVSSLAAVASVGVFAVAAHAADPIDTVSLTNAERQAHGLTALAVASDLQTEAQHHADDMAAAAALWHTPDLAKRIGGWKRLGENVGRGPSADAIHAGFMASPTHRANVLQPLYTQMGVGTATTGDGRLYVSVLYRLPTHARPVRVVAAPPARPTTPVPAAKIPVQVAGATVTRPQPAVESTSGAQLASANFAERGLRPANTRLTAEWLAAGLLVLAAGGHATRLARSLARR